MLSKVNIKSADVIALMIAAHSYPDKQRTQYYKHTTTVALSIPIINDEGLRKARPDLNNEAYNKLFNDINLFIEKCRVVGFMHDFVEDRKGELLELQYLKNLGFSSEVPKDMIFKNKDGQDSVKVGFGLLGFLGFDREMLDAARLLTKDSSKKDEYKDYIKSIKQSGNDIAVVVKYFDVLHNSSSDRASGSFFSSKVKGYGHHLNKRSKYKKTMLKLRPLVVDILSERLGVDRDMMEKNFKDRGGDILIATHALPARRRDKFKDKNLEIKLKKLGHEPDKDGNYDEVIQKLGRAIRMDYSRKPGGVGL